MSNVVVAAPYPTMPGPEAAATLALVRRLVADGEDVTVISPVASAAHHFTNYAGAKGAIRLARLAAGADVLHLRIDVDAMFPEQESARLLANRLALHGLLRRVPRTEVRLDRVHAGLSPRFAALVISPATRVLVASEEERDWLVAAGVPAAKVSLEPEPEPAVPSRPDRPPAPVVAASTVGGAPLSAADLQDLVRRRAAEERAARRRFVRPDDGAASLPLRHIARLERPQIGSRRPGGAFVKRLLMKALAWQFDPVIAAVNQLHQATIDSIDALDARQDEAAEATSR